MFVDLFTHQRCDFGYVVWCINIPEIQLTDC